MKLKNRHTIVRLLKNAGYFIEDTHVCRDQPNHLCVGLDICQSKNRGFRQARNALRKASIDEFIQVGLVWSEKSLDKAYPPATMLSLDDALKGKSGNFLFGCGHVVYDVGPTTELSIFHVDYPQP